MRPLHALRRQAVLFAALGTIALFGLSGAAQAWWSGAGAGRWLVFSLIAQAYFSTVLWRSLDQNHPEGSLVLYPTLGPANAITLLRAVLMSAVCGFLFLPRPEGAAAWLPGLMYTAASLPDYVDGAIARITGRTTILGETLDMTVDSVGVFTATTLAVQYGVLPTWYLPIGLARYLFVGGLWLRRRIGLPIFDLPFSHRRRAFAALKMGFMFVMLFPLFGPPGTHLAAAAFGIPFGAAFLWDWGLAAGWFSPGAWRRLKPAGAFVLGWGPWLLRAAAVVLIVPSVSKHLSDPALAGLGAAEALAAAALAVGAAPRVAAIAAVCLLGVNQNMAPLSVSQSVLVFVYIGLIFVGGGKGSVWPVEERLITQRLGDPDS